MVAPALIDHRHWPWAVVVACALATQAWGAGDAEIDREFEFGARLIKMGFPDFAERAMDRLSLARPDLKDRANVVRAEALIAQRRLKQAEELVATMPKDSPKAQAIMLALADGYFQTGEKDKCRSYYSSFFQQYGTNTPTDPDLLRFYRDAAYKFAQMLAMQNEVQAASEAYDLVLRSVADAEMARQARVEQADLLLRAAKKMAGPERDAAIAKAETNCNEVLWGGSDLWFARGIIALAGVHMAREKHDLAMRLLQDNLPMIKKIDDLLDRAQIPVAESPLAGARSLLGALHLREGEVLLAVKAARESEAIQYLARAVREYEGLWGLIVRVNVRDAALAKKETKDQPILTGTAAERQQPFVDIAQSLRQFDETLATNTLTAWEPATAPRMNALKDSVAKLRKTVEDYPKEIGVTPGPDVVLGDSFRGKAYTEHALLFLAPDDKRKERAIDEYVKALQEYYNVLAGYPGSEWSTSAGERGTVLMDRLKALTGK